MSEPEKRRFRELTFDHQLAVIDRTVQAVHALTRAVDVTPSNEDATLCLRAAEAFLVAELQEVTGMRLTERVEHQFVAN